MVARRAALAALALAAAACAGGRFSSRERRPYSGAAERRAGARAGLTVSSRHLRPARLTHARGAAGRAVAAASTLVGRRAIVVAGRDYGAGCAALIRAAYDQAGRPLPRSARDATALHALAAARGALRPNRGARPGDVVFFADQPGGPPAHAGLVARVDGEGAALVLYRAARGVVRLRVNLREPAPFDAAGKRLNDELVVPGGPVPAGRLLVDRAALL